MNTVPETLPPDLDGAVVKIRSGIEPSETAEHQTVSFREAIDRALAENIDLALARSDEQIARGRARSDRGALLPVLEFGGRAAHREGRVQGSFGRLRDVDFDTFEGGLSVAYRLNIGAQVHVAIASRREIEASTWRTLSTEQRLLFRVSELYQNLALARVGTRIAAQLVEDSEEFLRIASARADQGLGLGSEVARAKAKLAADRQELVGARRLWETASVRLAEVLLFDPRVLLEPEEDELHPLTLAPPLEAWDPTATAGSRPDVEAARRLQGAASQRVRAAWWDLLGPEILARWRGIEIGDVIEELDGQTNKEILVGWSISLEKLGRIKRSKGEQESARLKLVQAEQNARSEVETAKYEIRATAERIPLARDGLQASRENLSINQARYEAGTALGIEVLDAEDTLAQARLNLARSIVAFNLAQVRLLAAAGVLSRDRLVW